MAVNTSLQVVSSVLILFHRFKSAINLNCIQGIIGLQLASLKFINVY